MPEVQAPVIACADWPAVPSLAAGGGPPANGLAPPGGGSETTTSVGIAGARVGAGAVGLLATGGVVGVALTDDVGANGGRAATGGAVCSTASGFDSGPAR